MNLWRLEWLRLTRTWRGLGLLALFLAFGVLGPFTARYLGEIIGRLSTDQIRVQLSQPKPVDGILQYVSNTQQLGLLATIIIVISALGFDAHPDIATFLRTRASVTKLVLIRFAAYSVFVSLAFVLGGIAAWYETDVLIGRLPVSDMMTGLTLGTIYYVFVVAMTALAAGLSRGTVSGVVIGFGLVVAPALFGTIPELKYWLPFGLGTAIIDILKEGSASDHLRAAAVALLLIPVALFTAIRLMTRREV